MTDLHNQVATIDRWQRSIRVTVAVKTSMRKSCGNLNAVETAKSLTTSPRHVGMRELSNIPVRTSRVVCCYSLHKSVTF